MKPLTPRMRIFRMEVDYTSRAGRRKQLRQPRILTGPRLPGQTDRSAAERHAGRAVRSGVRGCEVRCRHRRAVELQLKDRKRASTAAARDEATIFNPHRWIARGRL